MSDLLTRDLTRRYNAGDEELGPRLLRSLLREQGDVEGGLVGVWFNRSWRMERKSDALGNGYARAHNRRGHASQKRSIPRSSGPTVSRG